MTDTILESKIRLKEKINKAILDFPDSAKTIRQLSKKAVIKEISFAGASFSFDEAGTFFAHEKKDNFKYKIIYYHPDYEGNSPEEFVWCFNKIS